MPRKSIVLIQKGVPNNVFIKINNNLKKLVKVMSNKRFIYFILIILATNVSLMSSRKNQEPQKRQPQQK